MADSFNDSPPPGKPQLYEHSISEQDETASIGYEEASKLGHSANHLYRQFGQFGRLSDLDKAISIYHEILTRLPTHHPNRSDFLNNLGSILGTRFSHTGQLSDLDESIGSLRETLELVSAPHPYRSAALNNLANMISTRFSQTGHLADLEEAVRLHRESLRLFHALHPHRSTSLYNLANILSTRFGRTGTLADLEESVRLHREALALRPLSHPDRSDSLNNLGAILDIRFGQTGQFEDADESIRLLREALVLRPEPHPNRSDSLNYFAIALHTQFSQTGQLSDIEEAVRLHREALDLRPTPHPSRSSSLTNLAATLNTRYELTGQHHDIEEAIQLHREVLGLRPAPHPDRSISLNNLANVLHTRAAHTNNIADVDEVIELHREALELRSAPHPDRSSSLNNLAGVLSMRFSRKGQIADIDESVMLHHEALLLRPLPHPDRVSSLNNLAYALDLRFRKTSQLPDIEHAITRCHESLHMLTQEHPAACTVLTNLGRIFLDKFNIKCESAPASQRLRAARFWAHHADGNHDSALEAYQNAIELLPRLATLGLDLQSRQQVLLSPSDGLARNAAACAIRFGQPDKAIEFLEEGRAIFWSQALQLRTPLDKLHLAAPNLATKLQDISRALEQGALRDISVDLSNSKRRKSLEQEIVHYRNLNRDWVNVLGEVRKLDEFKDFLRPSPFSMLRRAAVNGPVVILNAGKSGCAALILKASDVRHVALHDMTIDDAKTLVQLIRTVVTSDVRHTAPPNSEEPSIQHIRKDEEGHLDALYPLTRKGRRVADAAINSEFTFRSILEKLWRSVAEPVIRSLALNKTESPSRLWWYPTGLFAFLPVHAAGIYDVGPKDTECVSDYVVSSYTPTLKALLTLPPPLPIKNCFKMMVAIQPERMDYLPLPGTIDELRNIEAQVPPEYLLKLGTEAAPASVEAVYSHLPTAHIAHFACHGEQNVENPLESALILADGKLKVSRIMAQSMPKASLVFLSACQTAMGDKNLPDEAMHLAATLMFGGFRGAVATMWSIVDKDGPNIAGTFYEHLFHRNKQSVADKSSLGYADTTEAARALHLAVTKLRSEDSSFERWVPFVHFGL